MNRKGDSFDKEFQLENKNKKSGGSSRGKLPSWLLILAGVAVIGGVVAARQPALRTTENTPKTSINLPTSQPAVAEPAMSVTGINDQQADSSELEARFLTQNGESNAQYIMPIQTNSSIQGINMDLEPLATDSEGNPAYPLSDSSISVVWVDGKPFELKIEPQTNAAGEPESVSSTYWLEDQAYEVHLDPVDDTKAEAVSGTDQSSIVKIGSQSYLLRLTPASQTTGKTASAATTAADVKQTPETVHSADEDPFTADNSAGEDTAAANSAVVWLDSRPFAVTVKQQDGTTAAESSEPGQNSEEPKKEQLTTVFEAEGKEYSLEIEEIDKDEIPEGAGSVVWLDKTPLEVVLKADEPAGNSDTGIEVRLNPLPAEQTAAMQAERFGSAIPSETVPTEEPTAIPTQEPTPAPVEEAQDSNWFTNMFTNFFGSTPTNTPTPEVIVIALSPTPTAIQPTATPIVIQMAAAPVQQGPVKLDERDDSSSESKDDVSADPALVEAPAESAQEIDEDPVSTEVVEETKPQPTRSTAEKIDVVVLEPEDSSAKPTAQPTPEELPHTGTAESWNIPSMLGMLAGLLLVIIGVRRLRSRE